MNFFAKPERLYFAPLYSIKESSTTVTSVPVGVNVTVSPVSMPTMLNLKCGRLVFVGFTPSVSAVAAAAAELLKSKMEPAKSGEQVYKSQ